MKKIILFLLALSAVIFANAQARKTPTKTNTSTTTTKAKSTPAPVVKVAPKADVFSVDGKNLLNASIGIGTYYNGLPFGASFEHGFSDVISAGVFADYSSYTFPSQTYKETIVYGGVRGSYHFAKLLQVSNPNFDPYGGVSIGYFSVSNNGYAYNGFVAPYASSVFVGAHAGARYMFSDGIGGFAEVGYGVAALKLGLTFKF